MYRNGELETSRQDKRNFLYVRFLPTIQGKISNDVYLVNLGIQSDVEILKGI